MIGMIYTESQIYLAAWRHYLNREIVPRGRMRHIHPDIMNKTKLLDRLLVDSRDSGVLVFTQDSRDWSLTIYSHLRDTLWGPSRKIDL